MDHETLVTLTADVVSAYVSNNNAEASAVPELISSVYTALASAGAVIEAPTVEVKLTPAVSVRASVRLPQPCWRWCAPGPSQQSRWRDGSSQPPNRETRTGTRAQ